MDLTLFAQEVINGYALLALSFNGYEKLVGDLATPSALAEMARAYGCDVKDPAVASTLRLVSRLVRDNLKRLQVPPSL